MSPSLHTSLALLSMLWLPTCIQAHMQMSSPYPLRSPLDPDVPVEDKDYDMTNPLLSDGSNFPCKHYQNYTDGYVTKATYVSGGTYDMWLNGTVTHSGGSCQLSLSYDNGATFKVIKSMIGGCPLDSHLNFTVPQFAPASDSALISWSWFNLIGNREMYQNCARVKIITAPAGRHRRGSPYRRQSSSMDQLPDMFACNVGNGCQTIERREVVFPNPGDDVVYGQDAITPDPGPGYVLAGDSTSSVSSTATSSATGSTTTTDTTTTSTGSTTSTDTTTTSTGSTSSTETTTTSTGSTSSTSSSQIAVLDSSATTTSTTSQMVAPTTTSSISSLELPALASISSSTSATMSSEMPLTTSSTTMSANALSLSLPYVTVTVSPFPLYVGIPSTSSTGNMAGSFFTTSTTAFLTSTTTTSTTSFSSSLTSLTPNVDVISSSTSSSGASSTWSTVYQTTSTTSTSTNFVYTLAVSMPTTSSTTVPTTLMTSTRSATTSSTSGIATALLVACVPGTFTCDTPSSFSQCISSPSNPNGSTYVYMGSVAPGTTCVDGQITRQNAGACTPNGQLFCNGERAFYLCDEGGLIDMGPVAPGTACRNGVIEYE